MSSVRLDISRALLPSANVWSALQNNNNNEYYLSLADGSYNNNNKNNTYWVIPVEPEELVNLVFDAEADCWRNKHSSWDASKYHYHIGRIWAFIDSLGTGTYEIWKSICFVIMYPKPREIFAAHYRDRIAHHITAPYLKDVAYATHAHNGNVSFGNRKDVSAWHACLRIQSLMRKHPNGYVCGLDVRSFFMSIDKEVMWRTFVHYEKMFTPEGYTKVQREFIINLLKMMVFHNPATNCERRSPIQLWRYIPDNKSLFHMNGLPIGNYYAQLDANLLLAVVCEALRSFDITEFVDDFCIVTDTIEEMHKAIAIFSRTLRDLKLSMSPNKVYIQPVRHGIKWCGYVIRPTRMYVSNRPVRNCFTKIRTAMCDISLDNAKSLMCTINSYIGMMCHCSSYNIQMEICRMVCASGFKEFLYFKKRRGCLICNLKNRYKKTHLSQNDIIDVNNHIKQLKNDYNNYSKNHSPL